MMLEYDPQRRISAEEALRHRWIRRYAERQGDNIETPMLFNALNNMKKFHASQKLAQAALLFMGSKVRHFEQCTPL